MLGAGAVRPPEPRHLEEPRGRFHGRAAAVLRPASVDDVAAAVRLCAAARVGIVPWSGGTGLVGGQILETGPLPVLMSFERMTRIRDLDLTDNVLVAEAGAVLADVRATARRAGRLFPLTLASEGSARIGGLLATNAGGVNVLRYGNARDLCLGIEAVLADGTVLNGLSRLVKDNMGYDLRHLLIGSEGTLGLVTAASLRLHPIPQTTATAWVAVPSPEAALDLLAEARAELGNTISAFELIHAQGLAFLGEVLPHIPQPQTMDSEWFVLIEAADAASARIAARLEDVLELALEGALATDALIAQSDSQRAVFWGVRESIPEANRRIGAVSSHDISLPASRLAEFVARGVGTRRKTRPDAANQLLRASGRREPALQRLSAAGPREGRLRRNPRRGEGDRARSRGVSGRLGRRRTRRRPAEDRRSAALRRSGQPVGDAEAQDRARSTGDPEPGGGSRGVLRKCAPISGGGREMGARYPDWRV